MKTIAAVTLGLCIVGSSVWSDESERPNILVIMADDVGWASLGVYHGGIKSIETPNLDQLASQGVRLTDYYAEPSCTAGRSAFMTGQMPIRTGTWRTSRPFLKAPPLAHCSSMFKRTP